MNKFRHILSYVFPITVEKTDSSCNPVLEVMLYNGKYMLNSANTNYSFGTLHTLFRKVFRKLELDWSKINQVLILGFGTGSIASIINQYKAGCAITGVEIDEKVLELGDKYFQTNNLKNVTIIHESANRFFENNKEKYDLVIIDAFIDTIVPGELETEQFLLKLKKALSSEGVLIFNKVIYTQKIREQITPLKKTYEKVFSNVELLTVMRTGKIFVVKP